MRTALFTALSVAAVLVAVPSRADDKAACLQASLQGQTMRDAHKLVEARDQLRLCARKQCPAVVQRDCSAWLTDVEKSLPTVVISAKNAAGADLVDVAVSVDGAPLTAKLDGQAVPMNPGPHAFHFELADGTRLDQQALVREGEKNQSIAVVLKPPEPAPSASAAHAPAPSEGKAAASPDAAEGAGPWKTVGWITGAAGAAGLVVGTVFGFVAIGDKNGAHCDANNFCDGGALSSAHGAATVSDVAFVAGGVLLAGGLTLVLLSPSGGRESGALRVTPIAGANLGGLVLGGSWR
jgi:hypothetical protein